MKGEANVSPYLLNDEFMEYTNIKEFLEKELSAHEKSLFLDNDLTFNNCVHFLESLNNPHNPTIPVTMLRVVDTWLGKSRNSKLYYFSYMNQRYMTAVSYYYRQIDISSRFNKVIPYGNKIK